MKRESKNKRKGRRKRSNASNHPQICRLPSASRRPSDPPRGLGRVGPGGLQTPGNGVRSPSGGLHVTKEIGIISLTPFSGCV